MRRLLIRPGAIGDCLLTFPAMEALQADYTEVWVPGVMKPLVQFADRVDSIASTGLDWLAIPGVEGLQRPVLERLGTFDEIVSWYGTHQPEFRDAVSHLPFRFHPALPPPPGQPVIQVPPQERTRIVVHPYSGSPVKDWPLDRWDALALQWARNSPSGGTGSRCSTISTSWPAGWHRRRSTWGMIPASRT